MKKISHFYSRENFEKYGTELIGQLSSYLDKALKGDPDLPVLPDNSPEELFGKYKSLLENAAELKDLVKAVLNDSNHLHHPGYIGHQCAAPNPITALGSMMGGLLNNGSAVYEMGPANVAMERVVAKFFAAEFSLPPSADGLFTSGGSLGNLTALLAARQNKTDYDIWEEGIHRDDQPVFMVSEMNHYSVSRAVKIMGLGQKGIVSVPVDENYKMKTDVLEGLYQEAVNEGKRVIGLVANACSTATGSYDNLQSIAAFCKSHDIWFHIDGAHGGAAILSSKYQHLLKGAEFADSLVLDFHKMLMTPGLNTLILFRDANNSYSTFAQKASYLLNEEEEEDWYNFARRTMECTKSMMGLNVYLQLLMGGKELFTENVEYLYGLARKFADFCQQENEIDLLIKPEANIVCFRYMPSDHSSINSVNQQIRKSILSQGEFYIVQTDIDGNIYLRVSLMNPMTKTEDLKKLLRKVKETGRQVAS